MSEHQWYEFLAIDRPLTGKQIAELRAISTRAEISPRRFWNEYDYGDLRADPQKLVLRYFDAFLYWANWGTRRISLRLLASGVDAKSLRPYFAGEAGSLSTKGEFVVLDMVSEEHENYDFEDGILESIAPVRDELMQGDLRAAYLAWLVEAPMLDDDEREPPLPAGLGALTPAQAALADFLEIDPDWIAAAALRSPELQRDADEAFVRWVKQLPAGDKDEWLLRAGHDPTLTLGTELKRAFHKQHPRPSTPGKGRTIGELRTAAEEIEATREAVEAKAREKKRLAAERARNRELEVLAAEGDAAWTRLEALVEGREYAVAVQLALDLRDLATREGAAEAFDVRFKEMKKRQARRPTFFAHWNRKVPKRPGRGSR